MTIDKKCNNNRPRLRYVLVSFSVVGLWANAEISHPFYRRDRGIGQVLEFTAKSSRGTFGQQDRICPAGGAERLQWTGIRKGCANNSNSTI